MFTFFLFNTAFCQSLTDARFSVDFRQASIADFAKTIESQSSYHFYYDVKDLDTVKITLNVNQKPLDVILGAVFEKTTFHYLITRNNQVLISKDFAIITSGSRSKDSSFAALNGTVTLPEYLKSDQPGIVKEARNENKVYEIGFKSNIVQDRNVTLAGYVFNAASGEPVVGATVFVPEMKKGVATDQFGFYSISLKAGKYNLIIRAIGTKDTRRQIFLYSEGRLNIELSEQITALREVKISADKVFNVKGLEMGVNKLDIKSIREIPAVFGEADVLRAMLVLPGVQTVGEASAGFNVRGGSADQNLILLNDAVIYNPAHFFGFFSAFNPDIVKDVELHKSTIPERFGGRLSSVLEVNDREGNNKKLSGTAGIGLLTSRFSIEGPLKKDKTSFLFGGRTTYSDWLLKLLPESYKNSHASFYDLNLDISHQINEKNHLYFYSYWSNDNFKLNGDTSYEYSNKSIALKWKHNYSNQFYGTISGGFDRYQYQVKSEDNVLNAYRLAFDINQTNFKANFNYYPGTNHTVDFGLSAIYYKMNQGDFEPLGASSIVTPDKSPGQQALETALYAGDRYDITEKLSVNLGIRYSIYAFLGPRAVNYYAPGQPRTDNTLLESISYPAGKIIKTYAAPEVRLSARYTLGADLSLKASYNTLQQYLHLLTNTTAISPTDVYQLSDPNIRPQHGEQVSLGLYKNLKDNTIETSVETYYKVITNYLDYKSGAVLVLNRHIETDVVNTRGRAYGIEFLLKKNTGRLNGLMSYTYSRTFLKQDDENAGELINDGNDYPANYDKPHSINFTGNYRLSHRFSISLNVTYSTGRPITLPITKYSYAGSDRVFYSDRNAYRVPDYFRSDMSVNVEGNHVVKQRLKSSFTFGVYNLTGRQNAYSTYFTSRGGSVAGYQLSIFASAIPFVNYNLKF